MLLFNEKQGGYFGGYRKKLSRLFRTIGSAPVLCAKNRVKRPGSGLQK